MQFLKNLWLGLLGTILMGVGSLCNAHLMPAQQGTINIVGQAAFVVLAVPVSALVAADDNRDGRLSELELQAHTSKISEQVLQRFSIDDAGARSSGQVLQIMSEPDERVASGAGGAGGAGASHCLILMRFAFASEPSALGVETDLFGYRTDEQQLTLKLTRGTDTEAVVLTPRHTSHRFFQSGIEVLRDYAMVGIEHILLGWDHLLFLLTVVVGGRGWRYWAAVLTSFTLAHSVTLGASLMAWVQVPAAWVEPALAVSIVVMAAFNLARRDVAVPWRVAVVAACGLLHGLGFAGSMAQMGLHGVYRWTSLVGFNLGIELGQVVFLCAVLGGAALLQWGLARVPHMALLGLRLGVRAAGFASWCAIGLGAFWLVERLA